MASSCEMMACVSSKSSGGCLTFFRSRDSLIPGLPFFKIAVWDKSLDSHPVSIPSTFKPFVLPVPQKDELDGHRNAELQMPRDVQQSTLAIKQPMLILIKPVVRK